MDEGHPACQAGAEAQGVIGAGDIIMDCLRDGHDGHPLPLEASCVLQHIVIANDY